MSRPKRGPTAFTLIEMLVAVAIVWVGVDRRSTDVDRVDATIAHQLSSSECWRVPTDGLLAYAAPPLDAELPVPDDFGISLEESLL